jgi:sulfur-oxidizing protein SoxB
MVRVGGMTYAIDPMARIGARIFDLRLGDSPLRPSRRYKVAGWAPVAEGAGGEPIWDVLARFLRDRKVVRARALNLPRLVGVEGNPGIA